MKKIIVTGATSMPGTALIHTAVREGTEVYAIVRKDTKRADRIVSHPLVHTVYSSLETLQDTEGLPADCDALYHFAWTGTDKAQRDDPRRQEANIRYTLDAVELARKSGCGKFIGAGSQAEYGPTDGIINENTRTAPATCYGAAKLASGILSRKACDRYGIDFAWGRIFSLYGPHDKEGTMLISAIDAFIAGRTARFSAATQMWNYLYESDAGEMFYRLGKKECPPGIYLIANHESHALKEYICQLISMFGPGISYEFEKETNVPLPGLNADTRSTCERLGYTPAVSFRDGLKETIQARRNAEQARSMTGTTMKEW